MAILSFSQRNKMVNWSVGLRSKMVDQTVEFWETEFSSESILKSTINNFIYASQDMDQTTRRIGVSVRTVWEEFKEVFFSGFVQQGWKGTYTAIFKARSAERQEGWSIMIQQTWWTAEEEVGAVGAWGHEQEQVLLNHLKSAEGEALLCLLHVHYMW